MATLPTVPDQAAATDVRIEATDEARGWLRRLQEIHGPILLHQSGGCCDGSAPMCYTQSEFRVGTRDVLLGTLEGVPFYVGGQQYKVWKDWFVTLDARPGRAGIFSLEGSEGIRFVTTVSPLDGTSPGPPPVAEEACEVRPESDPTSAPESLR
jgi:uncharacterized protein (DUF779 family)